jgi:hypothetical protein
MTPRLNAVVCVLGEYAVDSEVVIKPPWVAGDIERKVGQVE